MQSQNNNQYNQLIGHEAIENADVWISDNDESDDESSENQTPLKRVMLALGYVTTGDFCLGLSMVAAEAILAGNFKTFKEKIQLLFSIDTATLQFKIKLAKTKELALGKNYLESEHCLMLEIDKLCRDIAVHSVPGAFPELFAKGKKITVHNVRKTLLATQSTLCRDTYDSGVIAFNYRQEQLWDYFTSLKYVIRNQSAAIVIRNAKHTITIGFHADTQTWSITHSGYLNVREFGNDSEITQALLQVFQGFPSPLCTTFISNVYLSSPPENTIENMQKWKTMQKAIVAKNIGSATEIENLHLLHAAADGDVDTLRVLLQAGCDPNKRLHQTTPLYIAACSEQLDVIRVILDSGAEPDCGYEDGFSPLIVAAKNGYVDVVRVLLAGGADPSEPCEDGTFPLLAAVESENNEVIRLLLPNAVILDENDARMLREAVNKLTDNVIKNEVETFINSKVEVLSQQQQMATPKINTPILSSLQSMFGIYHANSTITNTLPSNQHQIIIPTKKRKLSVSTFSQNKIAKNTLDGDVSKKQPVKCSSSS